MTQITLTEKNCGGFIEKAVEQGQAVYVVAFKRDDTNDAEFWGGDPMFTFGGMTQLQRELQSAYDEGIIEGQFQIMGRVYGDHFETTEEARNDASRFNIKVTNGSGVNITGILAKSDAIDGWNPGMGPGNRAQDGKALGTLEALTVSEAHVAICQIIDQGREHGPTDQEAEYLYSLIAPIMERGHGFIATPDGWMIEVKRTIDVLTATF